MKTFCYLAEFYDFIIQKICYICGIKKMNENIKEFKCLKMLSLN